LQSASGGEQLDIAAVAGANVAGLGVDVAAPSCLGEKLGDGGIGAGVFAIVVAFGFVGIFLGPTLLAVGLSVLGQWLKPTTTDATSTPVVPPG
jgi:hypothetical protein